MLVWWDIVVVWLDSLDLRASSAYTTAYNGLSGVNKILYYESNAFIIIILNIRLFPSPFKIPTCLFVLRTLTKSD